MKKILVVDDDADVLAVVEEVLVYEGFEVLAVTETGDIQKLVKQSNPNLVIIDYLLQGVNGGELCHHIKSDPVTGALPVILLSAYPKVFRSLGDYGCNAFIEKPFNLSTLIYTINELV